jgi:ribulose-phosphate 3-epimerase|tara:strand:+ start:11217 stop:11882 length:666 start_codon:yes stop_codon:yes gene_type:complete
MENKNVVISVSILSSNFMNLEKEITSLNFSGIDEFHLDVMDGHFVDNISFGLPIINCVRSLTELPIETHMMVDDPYSFVESFAKSKINTFTFHVESKSNIRDTISLLKEKKIRIGLVINPDTPISAIEPYINDIDRVLFMTVYPGQGGQNYILSVNDKINEFAKKYSNNNILIGVDGGIKLDTIKNSFLSGARMFISGTGILDSKLGYLGVVKEFRKTILK